MNGQDLLTCLLTVYTSHTPSSSSGGSNGDGQVKSLCMRIIGHFAILCIDTPSILFYVKSAIEQSTDQDLQEAGYYALGRLCETSRDLVRYARSIILERLRVDFQKAGRHLFSRVFLDPSTVIVLQSEFPLTYSSNLDSVDRIISLAYFHTMLSIKCPFMASETISNLITVSQSAVSDAVVTASARCLLKLARYCPFAFTSNKTFNALADLCLTSSDNPSASGYIFRTVIALLPSIHSHMPPLLLSHVCVKTMTISNSKNNNSDLYQVYGCHLLVHLMEFYPKMSVMASFVDMLANLMFNRAPWNKNHLQNQVRFSF